MSTHSTRASLPCRCRRSLGFSVLALALIGVATGREHLRAQPLQGTIMPVVHGVEIAEGQEMVMELPPGAELPPEVMEAMQAVRAGGGTNAPASPEQQRLQALLKLQFDRRPQELLQTLARQLDPAAVQTNEVQRFRDDVVGGRPWVSSSPPCPKRIVPKFTGTC